MDFPQLRIESTPAKLGLQIEKPTQQIEQPQADLSIQQPKAELTIHTTPGRLSIDQTKAWEDMDLKHISRRIEEFAENGKQDWLKGLARVAQQGDELMMIENGGNPLAEQAKVNSEDPMLEFNIGWIPSHFSVKTHYEPSKVNIDWKTNEPIINAHANKPRHHYTSGSVKGEMLQWPSLSINVVGLNFEKQK
jgi:hypothetical protein